MARTSKLVGDRLESFLEERGRGVPLRELAAKYGLTIARLSQIYRKAQPWDSGALGRSAEHAVPVSEVHDTGWFDPKELDEHRLSTY